jgi:hypothetical protein
MNTRQFLNLLAVVGFALFVIMLVVVTSMPPMTQALEIPPQALKGPISNAEQALAQALYFDSIFARHPKSVDGTDIESPYLTSRQTYADSRKTGEVFNDPKDAAQQVWVVTVKGEASLSLPGTFADQVYYDVTYIISAETGEIAGVVTR